MVNSIQSFVFDSPTNIGIEEIFLQDFRVILKPTLLRMVMDPI